MTTAEKMDSRLRGNDRWVGLRDAVSSFLPPAGYMQGQARGKDGLEVTWPMFVIPAQARNRGQAAAGIQAREGGL